MRTYRFFPVLPFHRRLRPVFDLLEMPAAVTPTRPIRPTTSNAPTRTITASPLRSRASPRSDLTAELSDGVLTVQGKHSEEAGKASYLYQGIAGRAFERRFQLAEHVHVRGAKLENGLLHIDLERVVPEEQKPRRIAINGANVQVIEGQAKAA